MAVIDELIIRNGTTATPADSYNDQTIDEIVYEGQTFHFAKQKDLTGTSEIVADNGVAEPIISLGVSGNTSQKSYGGYQLFQFKDYSGSKTDSDGNVLTWEIKDGVVTVNGKQNAFSFVTLDSKSVVPATYEAGTYTYTASYYGDGNVGGCDWRFRYVSDTTTIGIGGYTDGRTSRKVEVKTFDEPFYFRYAQLYIYANTEYKDFKFTLGLFKGSYTGETMPPYEPYVGGIPSPNPGQKIPIYTTTESTVDLTSDLESASITYNSDFLYTIAFEHPFSFNGAESLTLSVGGFYTGNAGDMLLVGADPSNIVGGYGAFDYLAAGDGSRSEVTIHSSGYGDTFYIGVGNTDIGIPSDKIEYYRQLALATTITATGTITTQTGVREIPAYPQEIVNANDRSTKTYKFSVNDFTWNDGAYTYETVFDINPAKSYKIYVKDKDESIYTDLIAYLDVDQNGLNTPSWLLRGWEYGEVAEVKGYSKLYYCLGYDGQPSQQEMQTYLNRYDLIVEELGITAVFYGDNLFNQEKMLEDSNCTKAIYNGYECIKIAPTKTSFLFPLEIPANSTFRMSFDYARPNGIDTYWSFKYDDGTYSSNFASFNNLSASEKFYKSTPSSYSPTSNIGKLFNNTTKKIVGIRMQFYSYKTLSPMYIKNFMVNYGTEHLPYTPYFREEITIPQSVTYTNIEGTSKTVPLLFSKWDKLTVDRRNNKVIYTEGSWFRKLTGTEGWVRHGWAYNNGYGTYYVVSANYFWKVIPQTGVAYCSHFKASTKYNHPAEYNSFVGYSGEGLIQICTDRETPVADFKLWLQQKYAEGDPVIVLVKRTTANTIEHDITNTDLGQSLLALASHKGTNYLEVSSDPAPSQTDLSYWRQIIPNE